MRRYCPGSRTRCPLKAHLVWTLKYRLSVASCTIPDDITNTQEREPVGDDGRFQSTPFEPLAFQARVVQFLEGLAGHLGHGREHLLELRRRHHASAEQPAHPLRQVARRGDDAAG